MTHPLLSATTLAFLAACAGGATPTTAQAQRLAEAQALLAAAEPDPYGALAITDDLLKAQPKWREARIVAGDGSLALSRLDRRDLDKGLVLADAANAYEQALSIEPKDGRTWHKLAEVRFELGNYDAARDACQRAVLEYQTAKATRSEMAPTAMLAARCDHAQFSARRREELKDGKRDDRGFVKAESKTAGYAESALQNLQQVVGLMPEQAYTLAADIYLQLGQTDQALAQYERGIRTKPDASDLHLRFQQLHADLGQTRALGGAYSRLLRENPTVPILRWYEGRALVMIGDEQRGRGNYQGSIDYYTKAAGDFGEYRAMMPAHADSAGEWLAICELSIARVACDSGDLKSAQQHLLAAEQASPRTLAYENDDPLKPAIVDSFRSHYLGVVGAISRALSSGGADSLQATLDFNESILQRHPGRFGFVYNNAALPARDLGVLIAQQAEAKPEAERKAALAKAMALWERSYAHYEQAARLSPDDPRIVNDCGLMLIYHLNRDFDRARALFEQAIAAGQRQLDALPADASADERQFLEEAVGDAWQNIAVLMTRHQHKPFAEAKPFLEKAVTFYPKERREAAQMLANEGRETPGNGVVPQSLRKALGKQPADASAQGQGGSAEALAKLKAECAKLAADGDLDGAMTAIDKALKDLKAYAPFQLLRGEYSLRYAREARDAQRKGVELMFEDAIAALKQAVALDGKPAQPRQLLAEALYDKGDLEAAAKTAGELVLHLQSEGGGKDGELAAAHTVRANASARLAIAQKGEGKDPKGALDDARASFRFLEQQKKLDDAMRRTWAATEQQTGSGNEAVGIYARLLAQKPDDQGLLAQLIDTARNMGAASAAVDALKAREDATGIWYLGQARFWAAADLRAAGSNDEAVAELDRAKAAFDQSMAKNKDYATSCKQWIAYCLGKKGNLLYAMDKFDDAEKALLDAVRADPSRIAEDLGLSETTKLGILRLADKFFRKQDLGRVEAIYRAASDAADSDLDLLNNSGLFARDWGNALERNGKAKEAMGMYEQSYKAYTRAQKLDPANVRLANDTALIAIHHLERDWDLSKKLLDAAIAEGPKQLDAIGKDKPQERKDLDEAIGDCFENLALWHLKHSKDAAAAKAAALESQKHHPGAGRPGARHHLAQAEKMLQDKAK